MQRTRFRGLDIAFPQPREMRLGRFMFGPSKPDLSSTSMRARIIPRHEQRDRRLEIGQKPVEQTG
jgi:hypothetical protein